ncbi:GIY-YIG nuclease family protein [Candidatus Dojkabacteria bacterium]|uniref:GIY-YIG nuclease family protein n=1 Tax=Candidatus Dojkabacteria bacterium TaxID=2099670 RepID=A0A955RI65_9BACT|nr:GIY-YIG nuclease family protein [Candidatus Dojkabacteria bacterium]
MLTNKIHSTLYIGTTADTERRFLQHRSKLLPGFSKKYNLMKLIFYEEYSLPNEAILREKQLKKWKRKWKERIINEVNPDWIDLAKS